MIEVVCEDCQEVQTAEIGGVPECEACGSRSLTGTAGYDSPDSSTA